MSKTKHDIKTLPKWAQVRIFDLQEIINDLHYQLNMTRVASLITTDPVRSWFTVTGPSTKGADPYCLWRLHENDPHCVCALNYKDILLVGRYREKTDE